MPSNIRPLPKHLLFKNLFERRRGDETLQALSEGLASFVANAARLIEDVEILLASGRFASATFLLTTADEEMAKAYIILDMCRLDFSRHGNALKGLCLAFYNHILKHAYNEVLRLPREFRDMNDVKGVWDISVTEWWPSDGETVPDLPHETYFDREMPLYVDFIDADQRWYIAENKAWEFRFKALLGSNVVSKSREELRKLEATMNAGLFAPECLSILNDIFRRKYINEQICREDLNRLYDAAAGRLHAERGIEEGVFHGSVLKRWPLYHFIISTSDFRRTG